MVCAGQEKSRSQMENAKDYLLVSICDPELCEDSLVILHNFLTADQLKMYIQDETKDIFVKSLKLMYDGENVSDFCKDTFRFYLEEKVITRTEDTDNALKKFFKSVLVKFNEEHSAVFSSSNISGILEQLP
jgi:hypothetical protein